MALDIEKALAEEAAKNVGGRPRKGENEQEPFQIFEKVSPVAPIHAAEQAAAIVGTNRQYVSDAKKLAQPMARASRPSAPKRTYVLWSFYYVKFIRFENSSSHK